MKDTAHYTDALGSIKYIAVKAVKQYGIESQIAKELGPVMAGLHRVENNAVTRSVQLQKCCSEHAT